MSSAQTDLLSTSMLAGDNGPSKRFRRLSVCVQEQCLPADVLG